MHECPIGGHQGVQHTYDRQTIHDLPLYVLSHMPSFPLKSHMSIQLWQEVHTIVICELKTCGAAWFTFIEYCLNMCRCVNKDRSLMYVIVMISQDMQCVIQIPHSELWYCYCFCGSRQYGATLTSSDLSTVGDVLFRTYSIHMLA
jgi:hypothetical protein